MSIFAVFCAFISVFLGNYFDLFTCTSFTFIKVSNQNTFSNDLYLFWDALNVLLTFCCVSAYNFYIFQWIFIADIYSHCKELISMFTKEKAYRYSVISSSWFVLLCYLDIVWFLYFIYTSLHTYVYLLFFLFSLKDFFYFALVLFLIGKINLSMKEIYIVCNFVHMSLKI